jgi:trimethylamine:corrinoid methyltransferase-like protein
VIAEGVKAGSFTGLPSTANNFREFFWFPEMFRHWNVGGWQKAGSPAVLDMAWEKAQQKIAESNYTLPEGQRKEVDRIYHKAVEYIRQRKR